MVKCEICGIETYMPFRCNYCGRYFCDQHRLPELHECTGLYEARKPKDVVFGTYSSSSGTFGNYSTSRVIRPYWFSKQEIRDLAIGLLVITLLPIIRVWSFFWNAPLIATGAIMILALAFMLHELAHKFSAQRVGMWAEFRLNMTGLIFTLLSIFLFQTGILPLVVIAPGAVMIAGLLNWKDYGRISIAGPATNIAQAIFYMVVFYFFSAPNAQFLALYGMAINSGLAIFNLIPFGLFDGQKIFKWSKAIWGISAVISVAIFLFSIYLQG